MFKEGLRPAWVEIDLKGLENNIKIIQSRVSPGSQSLFPLRSKIVNVQSDTRP